MCHQTLATRPSRYFSNSHARRDLPIPATPTTESRCAFSSSAEAWKSSLTSRSSRSRPTNGGSSPAERPSPPRFAITRSARQSWSGSVLPFSSCDAAVLVGDRCVARAAGRVADQHRSRLGRRLDAGGGVDEVAGDHALALGAERDRGLAGEHPGAHANVGAEPLDRRDELERRPDAALGVVLLRDGRAPERHHRVADELLDPAAVALDHVPRRLEVAREQLAGLLGVAALGLRREADQVGEEHGDEAPLGDRGRAQAAAPARAAGRASARAALRAELRRRCDEGPARGAGPGERGPALAAELRSGGVPSGRRGRARRRPSPDCRAMRRAPRASGVGGQDREGLARGRS